MRAVILAGGKGTRLAPYTTVLPKPLMPIGDRPILDIVLRQLAAQGFDRITLAVGHLAELIMAYCGDGSRYGVEITYSREESPLGTAGPLAVVRDLSSTFLSMNGDLLTALDYRAMFREHRRSGNVATVATFAREVAVDLGVIHADDNGRVVDYVEKPVLNYEASTGIYFFEPNALRLIPPAQRFDLPDLILGLIRHGDQVGVYRFGGHWLDIGRPDDYAKAVALFEASSDAFLPS
jgi:NDP-sugar pyrophosphorylase family protein